MSKPDIRFTSEPVELRASDKGGPGTISGYAAVYHDAKNPGTQYDIPGTDVRERILPGALRTATAEARSAISTFAHRDENLLGTVRAGTLRIAEDARGLKYEVDLPDTQAGRDVVALIKRGDVKGSSFEFVVSATDWSKEDGKRVRGIKSFKMIRQVGPVVDAAYEATTAEARAAIETEAAAALADPAPTVPAQWEIDGANRTRQLDLAERA